MRSIDLFEKRYPRTPKGEILAAADRDGYDMHIWFHGTRKRFDGFQLPKERGIDELGPGVYLTDQKWLANTWARERGFILFCVVRKGPLVDLGTIDRPDMQPVLLNGYVKAARDNPYNNHLSDSELTELFSYEWKSPRDKRQLINTCLAGAGYIGGYKHSSQIQGQIVVFKPEDVLIIARHGGKRHMTGYDD